MSPPPSCDPSADPFSVAVTNAGGTVFSGSLPSGALDKRNSRLWFHRDPAARQNGGLFRVKVSDRTNPDGFRIDVKGFGDMSTATDPVMTITTSMCGQTSTITKSWDEREGGTGWLVNLDPLDECTGTTPTPTPNP